MNAPIALLGGTFNPPHLGHINSALAALDQVGIAQLGLMPCKLPPHKLLTSVSEQHRVAMVKLACETSHRLYPQLIELSLPSPSYSVKTLRALRQQYPGTPLVFVMGEDSLHSLDSWYEWQALPALCHLLVMRRHDPAATMSPALSHWLEEHRCHDPAQLKQTRCGRVFIADTAYHGASSTAIREQAAMHNDMSPQTVQWLPAGIINYINQHNLYSNTK